MNKNGFIYGVSEKFAFPSPTGVTYYEYEKAMALLNKGIAFPSPTGVTYYEFVLKMKSGKIYKG